MSREMSPATATTNKGSFVEASQNLNFDHPSLRSLENRANIQVLRFNGRNFPPYHLTLITPKETVPRTHKLGIVILSGVKDTAEGNAPIVAEFYKEAEKAVDFKGERFDIGFSAVLDSSGSTRTINFANLRDQKLKELMK